MAPLSVSARLAAVALLVATAGLHAQTRAIPLPDTLGANFAIADSAGALGSATDFDFLVGMWHFTFQWRSPTGTFNPKFTGHWLAASAAVGDVDGDGKLEVVINSREGMLFVWDTDGPVKVGGRSALQWPKFHHDLRNSGNYNSALN